MNMGRYYRTFHSVQASYNRRFSHGVSFGVNWNWAIYDVSNRRRASTASTTMPTGRTWCAPDNDTAIEMFGDRGDTKHTVKGNFVWALPQLKSQNKTLKAIGLVVNDWQLSGIFTLDSGSPYDVGFSYQTGGGTNLTGSPDYNARIVIPNLGNVGSGCSSDQYSQFNNAMVAATAARRRSCRRCSPARSRGASASSRVRTI